MTTQNRSDSYNGDMSRRVEMHTAAMDWQASPSGTVWRKRLHRVGPAESGQVTSIVRYDKSSKFPAHPHPDGEEILVLEGVFSDEHGNWPAGTYLLHPEGFTHAPFSEQGCILFVKLRQYSGEGRSYVTVDTNAMAWEQSVVQGIEQKTLYRDPNFQDSTELERWAAGVDVGTLSYAGGVEIFVLQGEIEDERGRYQQGAWLRLPPGDQHRPGSANGCELYIKRDAVASLLSESV
ncbi:MAG: cupin domain-containing protein [Gammaproteobacteria bacterium]|nr:cupin domain-containing protein [Gammaproteobacteria bacterium]